MTLNIRRFQRRTNYNCSKFIVCLRFELCQRAFTAGRLRGWIMVEVENLARVLAEYDGNSPEAWNAYAGKAEVIWQSEAPA